MTVKMLSVNKPREFEVGVNISVILDDDARISLSSMVDNDSWFLFCVLGVQAEWLNERLQLWSDNAQYAEMCKCVSSLMTNDTAERGVQIIQHFIRTVAKMWLTCSGCCNV